MPGVNGDGPRDNLEAAQHTIAQMAPLAEDFRLDLDEVTIAIHIATARALIDIARSLRAIEGYICNLVPRR